MKINSKINKRVNESVAECRRVITEATIELLKSIGAEDGQETSFENTLILFQSKGNTTETIVCNMITYNEICSNPYLIVRQGDSYHSSYFLSIGSLFAIYDSVRAVVRSK